MTHVPTPRTPTDGDRRRRLLALAAGGLVLGVGAAMTFAAWTDTERATADFGAGRFGLQGAAQAPGDAPDDVFGDHPATGPALTVDFGDLAGVLTPGDTTSAPYALRLDPASTHQANVVLTGSTGSGDIADALSYSIVRTTGFGCDTTPVGTLVSDSPATATSPTSTPFSLADTDEIVYLCFQVSAGQTLEQGTTGSLAWTFTGTSTNPIG